MNNIFDIEDSLRLQGVDSIKRDIDKSKFDFFFGVDFMIKQSLVSDEDTLNDIINDTLDSAYDVMDDYYMHETCIYTLVSKDETYLECADYNQVFKTISNGYISYKLVIGFESKNIDNALQLYRLLILLLNIQKVTYHKFNIMSDNFMNVVKLYKNDRSLMTMLTAIYNKFTPHFDLTHIKLGFNVLYNQLSNMCNKLGIKKWFSFFNKQNAFPVDDGFECYTFDGKQQLNNYEVPVNARVYLKAVNMGGVIRLGSIDKPVEKYKKYLDEAIEFVKNNTFKSFIYNNEQGEPFYVLNKPFMIKDNEYIVMVKKVKNG